MRKASSLSLIYSPNDKMSDLELMAGSKTDIEDELDKELIYSLNFWPHKLIRISGSRKKIGQYINQMSSIMATFLMTYMIKSWFY